MADELIPMSSFTETAVTDDNDYIVMLVDGLNAKVKKIDFLEAVNTSLTGMFPKSGGIIGDLASRGNAYIGPYPFEGTLFSSLVIAGNITPLTDVNGAFTGSWVVGEDDNSNGAQMLVFTVNQGLKLINIPDTGATNDIYTDAELVALATTLGV
jgi:hypothetical protein